jgi:hypothetical protein
MGPRWTISLVFFGAALAWAQDPREIVRRSIAQDQLDWVKMKDYTWRAASVERHLDAHGKVQSTKAEKWETLVLDGQPHRRLLEKDGRPLSPQEQRTEQRKLDEVSRRLGAETSSEKVRRVEDAERQRKREFAFLSELPDLFDLRLEGESTMGGRPVWIISGAPRPGAQPRSRDARILLHIRGRMWIDKATYQWAKVEGETIGTISWGVFLARLDPGAHLTFEQTPVSEDLWLPKRLFMAGSGRLGLVKRLTQDEEIQWSDYKKFSVDSRILTESGPRPRN